MRRLGPPPAVCFGSSSAPSATSSTVSSADGPLVVVGTADQPRLVAHDGRLRRLEPPVELPLPPMLLPPMLPDPSWVPGGLWKSGHGGGSHSERMSDGHRTAATVRSAALSTAALARVSHLLSVCYHLRSPVSNLVVLLMPRWVRVGFGVSLQRSRCGWSRVGVSIVSCLYQGEQDHPALLMPPPPCGNLVWQRRASFGAYGLGIAISTQGTGFPFPRNKKKNVGSGTPAAPSSRAARTDTQ